MSQPEYDNRGYTNSGLKPPRDAMEEVEALIIELGLRNRDAIVEHILRQLLIEKPTLKNFHSAI